MRYGYSLIFIVLITAILLTITLSACGPTDEFKNHDKGANNSQGVGQDKSNKPEMTTICHKTGSPKKPYVEITIPGNALSEGHGTHEADIIPAPEGGCPAAE